jgi:acyl carrier protein
MRGMSPPGQISRDDLMAKLRAELRSIQPRLPQTWATGLLFTTDLGLDSLDLVEMSARLEQRYGLLIPDTELRSFVSLDAVADYLCAHAPRQPDGR